MSDENEDDFDYGETQIADLELLAALSDGGDDPSGEFPSDQDNGEGAGEGEVLDEDVAPISGGLSGGDFAFAFLGHSDSVFCVATVRDAAGNPLVVSGGGDNCAFIWAPDSGQTLHELRGHSDSVSVVGFSYDAALCATASLDGRVLVWDVKAGMLVDSLFDVGSEIEWLAWHPRGPVLAIGSGDGCVHMTGVNGRGLAFPVVYAGAHSGASCSVGGFTPDGRLLYSGGADGSFAVWDPRQQSPAPLHRWSRDSAVLGSAAASRRWLPTGEPVTAAAVHPAGIVAIVAGGAGSTRLVNLVSGGVLAELAAANATGHSIESVTFCDVPVSAPGVFAALASLTGTVAILDMSTTRLRALLAHEAPVPHACWIPGSFNLVSAALDGSLRLWDARSGTLLRTMTGHIQDIMGLAVDPLSRFVVTAADDHAALVFCIADDDSASIQMNLQLQE